MPERWRTELKKIDRLSLPDDLIDRLAGRPLPPLPGPRPSTRIAVSVFALLIAVAGSYGAFALIRGGGSIAPATGGSIDLPRTNPSGTATGGVPSLGGCTAAGITTGTELHLTAGATAARGMVFIPACLTVSAGQDFTIVFENRDTGVPHNVSISPPCTKWADAAGTICEIQPDPVFVGQTLTGPGTVVYQVSALPAGTYGFQDDVYTNMHGTLVVR